MPRHLLVVQQDPESYVRGFGPCRFLKPSSAVESTGHGDTESVAVKKGPSQLTASSSVVVVDVRPEDGASVRITVPTGGTSRAPVTGRVGYREGPPLGLLRGGECDLVVPLSTFGGIRLTLKEFVRELPRFGPSFFPLVTTVKVVTRRRKYLQPLSGHYAVTAPWRLSREVIDESGV